MIKQGVSALAFIVHRAGRCSYKGSGLGGERDCRQTTQREELRAGKQGDSLCR